MLTDWNPLLRQEFAEQYWAELQGFVQQERKLGAVYPPEGDVYAALPVSYTHLTLPTSDLV